MLSYILRRVFQSVLVLLVVGLVAFAMFRFVGDPIDTMLGQERTMEDIERLRESLGLNKPFFVQYWDFLVRAVQGDLGDFLPAGAARGRDHRRTSARDAGTGGRVRGLRADLRDRLRHLHRDPAGRVRGQRDHDDLLIGVSLPTFLIGILLIYLFAVELSWLPSFGRGDVVDLGWWSTGFLTHRG
jgi:peptide/nickel transport system permease protein